MKATAVVRRGFLSVLNFASILYSHALQESLSWHITWSCLLLAPSHASPLLKATLFYCDSTMCGAAFSSIQLVCLHLSHHKSVAFVIPLQAISVANARGGQAVKTNTIDVVLLPTQSLNLSDINRSRMSITLDFSIIGKKKWRTGLNWFQIIAHPSLALPYDEPAWDGM